MLLEEVIKENGFESKEEFHSLVANVDIRTPEKLGAFRRWQFEDATKEGILKLNFIK